MENGICEMPDVLESQLAWLLTTLPLNGKWYLRNARRAGVAAGVAADHTPFGC
jgi:hypothetical protein